MAEEVIRTLIALISICSFDLFLLQLELVNPLI